MRKKSSPCSPCRTISSRSSNWTGSRASATVCSSHVARFSDRTISTVNHYLSVVTTVVFSLHHHVCSATSHPTAFRVVGSGSGRLLQSMTACVSQGHSASSSSRTFMIAPVVSSSPRKRKSKSSVFFSWHQPVSSRPFIWQLAYLQYIHTQQYWVLCTNMKLLQTAMPINLRQSDRLNTSQRKYLKRHIKCFKHKHKINCRYL